MKNFLCPLIILLGAFPATADEKAAPRFENLSEFLVWADEKLSADDYEAMILAQSGSKDSHESKLAYLKTLDAKLGPAKMVKIFKDRSFPKDAETFKLGGCSMELGHCHIDFTKDGEAWKVVRIWQCR